MFPYMVKKLKRKAAVTESYGIPYKLKVLKIDPNQLKISAWDSDDRLK